MVVSFDDGKSLFDFAVRGGNGVKGVADSGITEVPELYIQQPEERIIIDKLNSNLVDDHLPIDLSGLDGPNHDQVVYQIARAAETLGFFQVINHGVPSELLESVKKAAHGFFNKPAKEKAVYLKGVSPSPAIMYGTSFAPEVEKELEWKDFIFLAYTNDDDALQYWPNECKEVALEYIKTCDKVAKTIFSVLIKKLGVTLDDKRVDALLGAKRIAMNFYPSCPNPDLTIGAGRHTDSGAITVLLQDGIGGLYVKVEEEEEEEEGGENKDVEKKKEEWWEIPPIRDTLVINIGDTIEILSNGRYKSAEHRVRASGTQSRVSVPFFALPNSSEMVGPLPEVLESTGGVPRYREFMFGEYTKYKYGKPHDGKNIFNGFARINSS